MPIFGTGLILAPPEIQMRPVEIRKSNYRFSFGKSGKQNFSCSDFRTPQDFALQIWMCKIFVELRFDNMFRQSYATAMKIKVALISLILLSACQSNESEVKDAREYAVSLTKEAMCKKGGRAEAMSEIAATAAAAPAAKVDETVYEVARRIEKQGCDKIIKKNAKRWGNG
jgi:hypothetical protein